ncbi:MAG: GNAT family N-acetyltransferase [Anaerolineae bacterium]|nr:GNAT family N-acetyltransferase [Anaerolineae bacterium]
MTTSIMNVPENLKCQEITTRPATLEDVPAIVELINTCSLADYGFVEETEDDVRNGLQTPGFNLATDSCCLLTSDGMMVGYAEFWNIVEPRVRPYLYGRTHPDYRGQGIGSFLCHWARNRAGDVVAQAPAGARVTLCVSTNVANKPAQALFQNEGFTPIRYFYRMVIDMGAPPPEPVWPDGITVRPIEYTREYLRRVFEANEDAFKDHWGHLPITFDKWLHWIEADPDFDPTVWWVAVAGDEIVATCLCRPKIAEDAKMGWVDDLGVRRPWRRRGLALALLHHTFGEFWRRGQTRVGLGVDASSLTGATQLYEKAGMHIARQYVQMEHELRPGQELSTQALQD